MKIAIISGSHRAKGQSGRVAQCIGKVIEKAGHEAYVHCLALSPLPLWDESMWGAEGSAKTAWIPLAKELQSADAFVFVSPEYNGTATAAMKNFFHFISVKEGAHKPAMLVGVSASLNGTYPIAELHSSSVKNCKITFIPDHLIVRNVAKVLHDDVEEEFKNADAYLRERIDYSLNILFAYGDALKPLRESTLWQNDKFNFGM